MKRFFLLFIIVLVASSALFSQTQYKFYLGTTEIKGKEFPTAVSTPVTITEFKNGNRKILVARTHPDGTKSTYLCAMKKSDELGTYFAGIQGESKVEWYISHSLMFATCDTGNSVEYFYDTYDYAKKAANKLNAPSSTATTAVASKPATTPSTNNSTKQYEFYCGSTYVRGGGYIPYVSPRPFILTISENGNKFVGRYGDGLTDVCYYSRSTEKGAYYVGKINGESKVEWFISKDKTFATRDYGSTVESYYRSSQKAREAADLVKEVVRSSQSNSSVGNSNSSSSTTSSNSKRRGCQSCSIPGGEGYAGNGQCRGCLGSGKKRILFEYTVCPNCQIKYETHGNGVCQWCKGTGWRD